MESKTSLSSEAQELVNSIETAIKDSVTRGVLKGRIKTPFNAMTQALVDYIVREVLDDYKTHGLYPLPYQYGSAVTLTLEFALDTETYKKDYVLQGVNLPNVCTVYKQDRMWRKV